ncbi:hypothetical protein GOP47_0015899 [Adiantum capillus-veneris]|uniref:Protein kinase domain-containing protein n=1 Tax=Adiantum capillus-veneris TaxID=13818 RepID=A0A9D4UKI2_ADICA|nr:hypothetical protein GOP47_0015899 [Adiantum capillus-veneris]
MGVSITAAPCLLKGSASCSWDTNNTDPCTWKGVNCTSTNEEYDIQSLYLSGFRLNGVIPAEINTLQALSTLYLSNNLLRGSFPPELGNCSSLLSVNLASNMLGGILPASLGKLPKLQVLDLSQNEITGSIPAEFGNLTSLQELNLESNQFTGTIEVISRLAALTDLSLSRNNFTGSLPADIGRFLYFLSLDNNRLSGTIPEDLGSCNRLTFLWLGGNSFTGSIPNSIGKIQYLVNFVADENKLSGTIPSNLSGWKYLSLLNLASNQLSGSLLSLEYLQLDGNALDGSLPPSIGKCEQLLDLQLGHNKFSGSIPTEIGDLVNSIISLNLSSNEFTGTIPASLGKLTKLVLLDLSHNHLTGPIPEELGGMFSLLNWSFADNSFSGAVPMTGPFANSTASSFANNPNLCSGPLPPCEEGSSSSSREKRNSHTFWKAAGSIAMDCALVILLALLIRYWCSKNRLAEVDEELKSLAEVRHFSAIGLFESTQGYSEENLLGEGATSMVYKGVFSNGEVVAVKKFKEDGISSSREALLQEVNILRKLRHRNLLKVRGCVINLDVQAMVLEFMPNGSLQQYLYQDANQYFQKRLSQQVVLKIAQGVANALAYLHHEYDAVPIIHGDVKPSNILLDFELEAHLADFGLAKLAKSSRGDISLTSNFKGSIGYIMRAKVPQKPLHQISLML